MIKSSLKICLNLRRKSLLSVLFLVIASSSFVEATAQEPAADSDSSKEKYGIWVAGEDDEGKRLQQMRLRVYPQAAAIPAFKHRLIPAANDRVDGNAAIFYLKAMGFFEQSSAQEQLAKLLRKWSDEATDEQRKLGDYPPYVWKEIEPESLPKEKVAQYLRLHSFQPEILYDAARRTRFEHDRAIERESNPIGYLLPSIQQHRQLARVQSLRCRFAIAEGRIDEAVEIVGQIMAMGVHLGTDEFLVSTLVGVALHGIGTDAGLMLSQQPETPNLYWALAACPDPAIDLKRAFAWERQFLLAQMPLLREVNEEIRSSDFWVDFTKRFAKVLNEFTKEYRDSFNQTSIEGWDELRIATTIARDYPAARDFLHEVYGMSEEKLDQYTKTQIVFLTIIKYNEFAQDEAYKHFVVPFATRTQANSSGIKRGSDLMEMWSERFSHSGQEPISSSILSLGDVLVAPSEHVVAAAAAAQQRQNLWQTVEALRLTAAENGGKLVESLDELSVPAPLDPGTNKPFEYESDGKVATLRASKINWHGREIKVELMSRDEQKEDNQ